jgi:hypothetical protein
LCADGYSGELCATCDDGYYLTSDSTCEACSGGSLFTPVFVIYLTIFVIAMTCVIVGLVIYFKYFSVEPVNQSHVATSSSIALINSVIVFGYAVKPGTSPKLVQLMIAVEQYYVWFRLRFKEVSTKLKIIISTMQIILSTAVVLNITMPTNFTNFTNGISFVSLNFGSVMPLQCTGAYSFVD